MKSFNEQVWDLCRKIPEGKVSTYKDISHALNTKAYRAVGNALNKNPYAPEVPCHRVVRSNGDLGGFAYGTEQKKKLLEQEGLKIKENNIMSFKERVFYFTDHLYGTNLK